MTGYAFSLEERRDILEQLLAQLGGGLQAVLKGGQVLVRRRQNPADAGDLTSGYPALVLDPAIEKLAEQAGLIPAPDSPGVTRLSFVSARPSLVESALVAGSAVHVVTYRDGNISNAAVLYFRSNRDAEECARVLTNAVRP